MKNREPHVTPHECLTHPHDVAIQATRCLTHPFTTLAPTPFRGERGLGLTEPNPADAPTRDSLRIPTKSVDIPRLSVTSARFAVTTPRFRMDTGDASNACWKHRAQVRHRALASRPKASVHAVLALHDSKRRHQELERAAAWLSRCATSIKARSKPGHVKRPLSFRCYPSRPIWLMFFNWVTSEAGFEPGEEFACR